MGFVRRFFAWLFSKPIRGPSSKHPDLYPLDDTELAKALNLHAEGKRHGEANQPASDSTALSGIESRILQRIDKARQDYLDWANMRLAVLTEDLSRLNVTPVVNKALQADKEFERVSSGLLAERESIVRALAEAAARRQEELDRFKTENGLARTPDFPQGGNKFFRIVALLFLIVIEALANSYFFAQGLTTGLIGGFLQAAFFAALNVVLASTQGRFTVPYVFHNDFWKSAAGWLSLALALGLMTGVSLTIGHYRDALVAEAAEPAKTALQAFQNTPFSLADLNSWLLFVVSMGFALLALVDGFFLDDVYPGYGRHARRTAQARDDFYEELSAVREDLEHLKEDALSNLEKDVNQAQSLIVQQDVLIQTKESSAARLETAMLNAQRCLETLINLFRTENRIYRRTPPPETFSSIPKLQKLNLTDFRVPQSREDFKDQSEKVQGLLAAVQTLRAAIQAAFTSEFDRLQPLETHLAVGRAVPPSSEAAL